MVYNVTGLRAISYVSFSLNLTCSVSDGACDRNLFRDDVSGDSEIRIVQVLCASHALAVLPAFTALHCAKGDQGGVNLRLAARQRQGLAQITGALGVLPAGNGLDDSDFVDFLVTGEDAAGNEALRVVRLFIGALAPGVVNIQRDDLGDPLNFVEGGAPLPVFPTVHTNTRNSFTGAVTNFVQPAFVRYAADKARALANSGVPKFDLGGGRFIWASISQADVVDITAVHVTLINAESGAELVVSTAATPFGATEVRSVNAGEKTSTFSIVLDTEGRSSPLLSSMQVSVWIDGLRYVNTAANFSLVPRLVQLRVMQAAGGVIAFAERPITMRAVNQPPAVTGTPGSVTFHELPVSTDKTSPWLQNDVAILPGAVVSDADDAHFTFATIAIANETCDPLRDELFVQSGYAVNPPVQGVWSAVTCVLQLRPTLLPGGQVPAPAAMSDLAMAMRAARFRTRDPLYPAGPSNATRLLVAVVQDAGSNGAAPPRRSIPVEWHLNFALVDDPPQLVAASAYGPGGFLHSADENANAFPVLFERQTYLMRSFVALRPDPPNNTLIADGTLALIKTTSIAMDLGFPSSWPNPTSAPVRYGAGGGILDPDSLAPPAVSCAYSRSQPINDPDPITPSQSCVRVVLQVRPHNRALPAPLAHL